MSYSFKPMSEEEFKIKVVEYGIYDFEVIRSNRKTSKVGNPMAELNLKIYDNEGKSHPVFDYLVFSNIALNIKKVKHFCDATGLEEAYMKGEIPEELGGYCGKVEIGIQGPQPNPNGGVYPEKNVVIDYVKSDYVKSDSVIDKKAKVDDGFDDTLPF